MKIHLAFICQYNNTGIGGGDRKFWLYYKNLDPDLFLGKIIFITRDKKDIDLSGENIVLTEEMICDYLKTERVEFVYFGYFSKGKEISTWVTQSILEDYIGLINVNFTPAYREHPKIYNLIISMTDYWKLKWMHGELPNSYVVYNPVDVELWKKERAKAIGKYRESFKEKKYILGRIARAEPSKWHWLILATLKQLDREKNYQYGYLFAGMPWLYRKYISFFLSKKMQSCILEIPEQRKYEDLAEFYASIDIFWQAAWIGESFGNVIAEAACFAVPSIVEAKYFYTDKKVNPKYYDAQIELVDHEITGYYGDTPDTILRFLEKSTKKSLENLGKHAEEKVISQYHIKHTINTLAKVLYEIGKERGIYKSNLIFEDIQKIPDAVTIKNYEHEYGKRLALSRQINTIGGLSWIQFKGKGILWRGVEYIYLIIRKILKKYFHKDIEKYSLKPF